MMKTKMFGPKSLNCKSYWKKVGDSYEVGFRFKGKPLFFGNFLHQKEATEWYRVMNSEIKHFSEKYTFGPKFPESFFKKFISNHLYATYYSYLDKKFAGYRSQYKKAVSGYRKDYSEIRKEWTASERSSFWKVS